LRADLYAIHDELYFVKVQLARQLTRADMVRLVLGSSALTVGLIELRLF
jgi:hypothetical protein